MLRQDIGKAFSGQAAALLVSFATSVVIARALGPEGRGLLALAVLIPAVTASFAIMGQDSVNSAFAGLYKQHRGALFLQSILITIFGALVGLVVIGGLFFWLPVPKGNFAKLLDRDLVWTAWVIAPSTIFGALMLALVRGVGKIGRAAVLSVVQAAAMLGLCLILLGWLGLGLTAAVWIVALAPLAAGLPAIWVLRKDISLNPRQLRGWLLRKSLAIGLPGSLATLATFLVLRLDQGMLAYMGSEADLGLYVVAVVLAEQLKILPTSISSAFVPRLANQIDSWRKEVPAVFRATLIAAAASMAGVAVVGPPAILLCFGTRFAGSILPFVILLPGVAALGGIGVLSGDLLTREKPLYSLWISWATLAVNVALNLVLIPLIGIAGAALASTISYVTALVLWAFSYKRESGRPYRQLLPGRGDLALVWHSGMDLLSKAFKRSRSP